MSKLKPIKGGQRPQRNEPCPCKSGLKYKFCHGDPTKNAKVRDMANKYMAHLIVEDKIARGMIEPPQQDVCVDKNELNEQGE